MEAKTVKETRQWVVEPKENDEGRSLRVALVVHTNRGGYTEEEYLFEFDADGTHMTIWNTNNDFMNIPLVPLQYLKDFLRELLEEQS